MPSGVEEGSERSAEVDKVSPIVHGGPCLSGMLEKVDDLCTLSEQSKLCFFSPSAYDVQCLASTYSSSSSHHCFRPCSLSPFLSLFPPATLPRHSPLSGAAGSLHVAEEGGLGGQGRGGGRVG